MDESVCFSVAGIGFSLSSPRSISRPGGLGRYSHFDMPSSRLVGDPDIRLDVVCSPAADWVEDDVEFDSGSWRAIRRGPLRLLACVNPDDDQPNVASIPEDGNDVTVFHPMGRRDATTPVRHPLRHPFDQAILMHLLPRFDGILVHSAGLVCDGRGVVCVGKSGAGKSTISTIANEAGRDVLSDDRIIIRKVDGDYRMYGTPWPGDCGFARNESVPLTGLCFLTQAAENRATPADAATAFARLIPTVSVPMYDKQLVSGYLAIIDDLLQSVGLFDLCFTRDGGVTDIIAELVNGVPVAGR